MWLIYYNKGHIILTPGYQRYWSSRREALDWAEAQGYDLAYIEVMPTIWPEESGR